MIAFANPMMREFTQAVTCKANRESRTTLIRRQLLASNSATSAARSKTLPTAAPHSSSRAPSDRSSVTRLATAPTAGSRPAPKATFASHTALAMRPRDARVVLIAESTPPENMSRSSSASPINASAGTSPRSNILARSCPLTFRDFCRRPSTGMPLSAICKTSSI